jgi:multicomponent Na+:H+ antiporter subunit G
MEGHQMSALEIAGTTLMGTGTLFTVLAAWGVVRFPSAPARMHAATKSASLGLALLATGAAVAAGSWPLAGIAVLVSVFLFLTAPISGHLLGRAAILAGQGGALVHDDLTGAAAGPLPAGEEDGSRFSVVRWAGLAVAWMLLWRDVGPGTALGGALVGLTIETARRERYRARRVSVPWLAVFLVRYAGWVVTSNLRVAWEVLTPSNEDIREAIVAVPLRTRSVPVALLVANAISYTPGSLTVELGGDPPKLWVHVLHFTSVEQVRADVARLEGLALRVLPQPASV